MASARVLGTEGVHLAESGDCAAAVPKLEAAERLYHAPTTLERLGECQVALGKIIAGSESLNRVVREPLATGAPQAFVAAQQRASQALAAARRRIGTLRLHIDGAPTSSVQVTVDGANVPSALFDASRPTDPGTHDVRAAAQGYRPVTTSVRVPEGSEANLVLRLEPDPTAGTSAPGPAPVAALTPASPASAPPPPDNTGPTASAPPPPSSPPAERTAGASGGGGRIVGYVLLGVGGAGIVVGSVFGGLALGTKSSLDSACLTKTACPPSSQGDIDDLATRATISTIGFGVGVAGVLVGSVILATSHSESPQVGARARGTRVSPWIGLGAAGVRGTFE
ncbi:MAG: hypothetical protein ABTD50_16595 [Polyangiaceae bacterium]|jgi:hypothetical protein